MARAKKAPVVKSIIIEGAPVIERAIVRFSHIVLQFTVENGDQISYEVLETLVNPEVADAIEYATVRFSEVVCQFVVTAGTTVHAYELEPVYQEIGGGPTPPVDPTDSFIKEIRQGAISTGSPAANRVTLVLNTLSTDELPRIKITINDSNIRSYAAGFVHNPNEADAGNAQTANVTYIYAVNKDTSYVYQLGDPFKFDAKANNLTPSDSFGWHEWSEIDYVITKNSQYEISVLGLALMFKYADDSSITPEQLRAAISIEEV